MSRFPTLRDGLNVWMVPFVLTAFLISESADARRASDSRGRRQSLQVQSDTTDDYEDENDSDDDDQVEAKQGPWKLPVPMRYQKKGYSLRIDKKLQSLNNPSIIIAPKELPSYVALIDSYGRVEERKRTTLNPHLLGGFKPRTYRISGGWGLTRFSGPVVERYGLSPWLTQFSTEFYYQPGPVGFVTGIDLAGGASSNSSGGESFGLNTIRIGGVLESGWFYRSQNFRWHQVMQAGLALSHYRISIEDREKAGSAKDADNAFKTIDRGFGIGPYASIDSLYMFEHWWWGGRFSLKQEGFKQDQTNSVERLDSSGSHFQVGLALVGSFTW